MINDLLALLADVPPRLAMLWAGWMTVGLMLNLWHRRAKKWLVVHDTSHGPRPKSGVRPPSGVKKTAPARTPSSVDAFGELEALLDQPTEPTPSGFHRRPGDSPVLSEAPPMLAGPRALP
jgi:hypothetical protein